MEVDIQQILQRNLIGAYVRKTLEFYSAMITKNLTDMSYIKLEVLSRLRKEIIDYMFLFLDYVHIRFIRPNLEQIRFTNNAKKQPKIAPTKTSKGKCTPTYICP